MSFLHPDFLVKYNGLRPKYAGPLFEWVYYTKYCRWIEEEKRRETWAETVARVVNYNVGLYSGPARKEDLIKEAELMFDNIFHLRTYPAGRALWVAGTKAAELYPESLFNCTGIIIQSIEDFCDLFHLLMVGAGVGFRVLKEDVDKLPEFNTNVTFKHKEYKYTKADTQTEQDETDSAWHLSSPWVLDIRSITIGDSKDAWVEALKDVLSVMSLVKEPFTISFNYDYVRPAGERIKTFGGRAAGHEGLKDMFEKLNQMIKQCNGKLTSVAAMDLCNIIAQNVVVGGGRRSAQMALGPDNDDEFINAKVDLPLEMSHRRMSNNTIVVNEYPTREKVGEILDRVRASWEPGFLNYKAFQSKRAWAETLNPCGESIMANRGNCNLAGTFLTSHLNENKTDFDWKSLETSHRLAVRISLRQTNVTWSLPKWDEVHKRDRLLGVSFTGLMKALDSLDIEFDNNKAIYLFKKLKFWALDEARKYAHEMRIPEPILVTLLKPEGTLTLLSDATSCGLHRSYAPYYIRRIKLSKMDPVCKVFKYLGIAVEQDTKKPDRVVFSFPIASGAKTAANDEPAKDQLYRYFILMKEYVQQNASCTLTIGPDEWEDMGDRIHTYWDNIVAIALANKNLEENGNYDQLPYEAISKEKYEEMISTFPDLSNCLELINKAEKGIEFEYEEDDGNIATTATECSGGVCGVR